MFPDFRPSTLPAPFVANGSMAIRSPSSSTSSPWSPTLGIDLPAWTVYRSMEWPVRFAMGLKPNDSIVRSIAAPMMRVGTFGRTTSIAAANAASDARISSVQFRVPISTVAAVSVRYPSTWAPRSILTTSPRRSVRTSLCVGVSCAATSFTERHVGNAGGHPCARMNSSILSTPSRIVIPSRSISAPCLRASRETLPARRSFSTMSPDKSKAVRRNRPFPYNPWLRTREVHDRGLAAHGTRPRVEVQVDGVAELLFGLPRLDGRRFPVDVRARGGNRPEAFREEERNRGIRDADRDHALRRDRGLRRVGGGAEQQGQGPGQPPAAPRFRARRDDCEIPGGVDGRDHDRHRLTRGPLLGGEDSRDGVRVERVRPEGVQRVRRVDDELTAKKHRQDVVHGRRVEDCLTLDHHRPHDARHGSPRPLTNVPPDGTPQLP